MKTIFKYCVMSNRFVLRPLLLLLGLAMVSQSGFGSVLFYDPIPTGYTEGANLGSATAGGSANNWAAFTNGTATVTATSSTTNIWVSSTNALTYPGLISYPSPSLGIHVKAPSPGYQCDVVSSNWPAQTSNSVYVSFLYKVITAPTALRTFAGFTDGKTLAGTTVKASLCLDTNLNLTCQKAGQQYPQPSNVGNGVTFLGPLTLGSTNLVVFRYNIISGSANDSLDLWLNPSASTFGNNALIPSAGMQSVVTNASDPSQIAAFLLHLTSSTTVGEWVFDEVRVGTNWADVTPSVSAASSTLTSVSATPSTGVPDDGATASTITITVTNLAGQPVVGLAAASIVVSASGAAVVTQPTVATDANGRTTCTIVSSSPGVVTVSVTIGGVVITSQPTVQFVDAGAKNLVWTGNSSSSWDTTSVNWSNTATAGSAIYSQYDNVIFNDAVSASGQTNVNLTAMMTPSSLTVSNNSKNYIISGSGAIGGSVALTKDGSGTLTIANSGGNTFTYTNGLTSTANLLAGTLVLSGYDNELPTGAVVAMTNTAVLNLNTNNQTLANISGQVGNTLMLGTGVLTDSGGGNFQGVISGVGQLIKTNYLTGGTLVLSNANTYSGGTLIGGYTNNTSVTVANATGSGTGSGFVLVLSTNGTLNIGAAGTAGSVSVNYITNNGTVGLRRSDNFNFPNNLVGSGTLSVNTATNNTVAVSGTNYCAGGTSISSGNLLISNPGVLGVNIVNIGQSGSPSIPCALQLSNNIVFTNSIAMVFRSSAQGFTPNLENVGGSNTITGPIQFYNNGGNGAGVYATAGYLQIVGSVIETTLPTSEATAKIIRLNGTTGIGEWSGNIIDSVAGIATAVHIDGPNTWILSGTDTYSGGTLVENGTLLVNGALQGYTGFGIIPDVVVTNSAILGGNGNIAGFTTVAGGAKVTPGTGGLTFGSSLSLSQLATNVFVVTGGVAAANPITVSGTLTSAYSQIEVNTAGGQLAPGVYKLFAYGSFSGSFMPTALFDTTQTAKYGVISNDTVNSLIDLVVTTPSNSDARLASLVINPLGTLTPAFAVSTASYAATIPNASSSVSITVTNDFYYSTSTLYLNGVSKGFLPSGVASASLPIGVGSTNVIMVQVTAADGLTTSNYTVTVTRLSTNALLTKLSFASGSVTPSFTGVTFGGYLVTNLTSYSVLIVTNSDLSASDTLFLNGLASGAITSGVPSMKIYPNLGSNYVAVQVVSQDLSVTNYYTIGLIRLPSNDATLAGLVVTPGVLSPAFTVGPKNFSVTNANTISSVQITVTNTDLNATNTLSLNGIAQGVITSSVPSLAMNMNVGTNTIIIKVVSQDSSTTNSFTVSVIRLGSSVSLAPFIITNSVVGGNSLFLTWPADHTGYRLLQQTNNLTQGVSSNTNDWGSIGYTTTNAAILPINLKTNAFYRLVYP